MYCIFFFVYHSGNRIFFIRLKITKSICFIITVKLNAVIRCFQVIYLDIKKHFFALILRTQNEKGSLFFFGNNFLFCTIISRCLTNNELLKFFQKIFILLDSLPRDVFVLLEHHFSHLH
jgi:hypothetical protein